MPRLVLYGARLRLRRWQRTDLPWSLLLLNDPDSLAAEGRTSPWTADEVEGASRSISSRGWDFTALHGNERVGEFVLTLNGPEPNTARIDLVVSPEFRRRGYGREGVAVCALFAFETLGMDAVYAVVRHENSASLRLHRSLGYRRKRHFDNGETAMLVLRNTASNRDRLRILRM